MRFSAIGALFGGTQNENYSGIWGLCWGHTSYGNLPLGDQLRDTTSFCACHATVRSLDLRGYLLIRASCLHGPVGHLWEACAAIL